MRKKLVMPLVVGALIWAAPLRADVYNFDNYCIGGFMGVCASVRVSTFYDVTSSSYKLQMEVWNLEGSTFGGTPLGEAHTITSLGLYYSSPTTLPSTIELKSVFYGTDDISTYWSMPANDIQTLGGVTLEISGGTSGNVGINGCTELPGGMKWLTCPDPASPASSVIFTFDTGDKEFSLANLELRWHSQQIGANEFSLKCDTGGAGDYPPCEVVPEPITMILLGSGLVGLGGARLARRRRRGLGEVEEV